MWHHPNHEYPRQATAPVRKKPVAAASPLHGLGTGEDTVSETQKLHLSHNLMPYFPLNLEKKTGFRTIFTNPDFKHAHTCLNKEMLSFR